MLDIVRAAMGVKSPSTVLSRANSMLAFIRWHTLGPPNDEMLPLKEEAAWQYVSHLKESGASASKATSFVQACRFCHYVLRVEGALQVVSSRRVCGLADIQLSGKREAKQARPLTVKEAQDLYRVASCSARHLVDRIVASHLLLMLYCRCRHSDTVAVEDVLHGHSEGAGCVQLRTKYHKGSKAAAKKSLLLPIVGSSEGDVSHLRRKVQPRCTAKSILANCNAHLSYPKTSRIPRARSGPYDSKGEHRASDLGEAS